MRIEFHCKCGLQNFNKEDWLAHWKYGVARNPNFGPKLTHYPKFLNTRPKLRAVYLFLLTEIRIAK